MKLPRMLAQRPTPRMPELAGFEPRFDAIPAPRMHQPAEVVRLLYWWARDLRDRGDFLLGVRFDAAQLAAAVTVRLASYRVVEVVRRHDDKPRMPHDLPTLLAEAVWRLGALGWADHVEALVDRLRTVGLIAAPASVCGCTKQIPGWVSQPDRAVRIARWWALALLRHGWRLHACGDALAGAGSSLRSPPWTATRCWWSTRGIWPMTAPRPQHWLTILRGSTTASVSSCSGSSATPWPERAGDLKCLAHRASRRW